MADVKPTDLFVSSEEAIEVDAETKAAIERGMRDAEAGRVVSFDEVKKLTAEWISRLSTPDRR